MPERHILSLAQSRDLKRLESVLDSGDRSLARIEMFLLQLMIGVLNREQKFPPGARDG